MHRTGACSLGCMWTSRWTDHECKKGGCNPILHYLQLKWRRGCTTAPVVARTQECALWLTAEEGGRGSSNSSSLLVKAMKEMRSTKILRISKCWMKAIDPDLPNPTRITLLSSHSVYHLPWPIERWINTQWQCCGNKTDNSMTHPIAQFLCLTFPSQCFTHNHFLYMGSFSPLSDPVYIDIRIVYTPYAFWEHFLSWEAHRSTVLARNC